jgi:hypothetical protein
MVLIQQMTAVCLCCLGMCLFLETFLDVQTVARRKRSEVAFQSTQRFSVISKQQQQHTILSKYQSPLEEFSPRLAAAAAPLPNVLAVVEKYKQEHSVDALLRDDSVNRHQRRFIVGYYSCPTSAGNWLHYFTSNFFWGILTNRTVLWKYADYDTCMGLRTNFYYKFNKNRCNVSGTVEDCGNFMTRAPWIPSYDEWKEKWNLPEPHHIKKIHTQWYQDAPRPKHRKVSQLVGLKYLYRLRAPDECSCAVHSSLDHSSPLLLVQPLVDPAFVDVIYKDNIVVDIHPWAFLRMDYLYMMPHLVDIQLGTQYAKDMLEQLGEWSSPFLFGLLLRHSFDYAIPIRQSVLYHPAVLAPKSRQDNRSVLTVAIHSRHINGMDSGCNITMERSAMLDIMQQARMQRNNTTKHIACQVTLLSDRTCTIAVMKKWLDERLGCTAVATDHQVVNAAFKEHGPFSGAGFFKDMLMAGLTVNDAMVGSLEPEDGNRWRSSSELIEEAIAYNRAMSYWQSGRDPKELPSMLWSTIVTDEP